MYRCINDIFYGYCKGQPEGETDETGYKPGSCRRQSKSCIKYLKNSELTPVKKK